MTFEARGLDAITLFVEDLERAKAFYLDMLGLQTVFEDADSAAFRLGSTTVNLLRVEAAGTLVEPASVGSPESGARFQLTIGVENVDAACSELERRGVRLLNGPVDREWGVRTAAFADPAGHVWELAQPLAG